MENSASQQLANECYEFSRDSSGKNCMIDSNDCASSKWLNPGTISYEFQRMLSKVLMESASGDDAPIEWKTIPSRKNAHFGQYAKVDINTQEFSINSETSEAINNRIIASNKKSIFNKVFKMKLGPSSDGKFYDMNFNLFLIHVLMKETFGNVNKKTTLRII